MKDSIFFSGLFCLGLSLLMTGLHADEITPSAPPSHDLTLWYTKPASSAMNEALPIGNARIGGLILGGVADERVVLNEDSLWTGDENLSGGYDGNGGFGSYQTLGNLLIHLPGHDQGVSNYQRDLDIERSLAHVSYDSGGVHYRREYFCSYPDNVMVAHLSADKPGSYTGLIELIDSHESVTRANGNTLIFASALSNKLKYEAQVAVLHDGGNVEAEGNKILFQNCDSVTLIFAAGTDYAMDYAAGFRGGDPHKRISQQIADASSKSYDNLKSAHVEDYQSLFSRVSLDLGTSYPAQRALPIDKRKVLAAQAEDPGLESLLYQYGRYLIISSSRPGGLPTNLQGRWSDDNHPAWNADYHTDINIQMNYWGVESANLSECHLPLINFIQSSLEPWRKATDASNDFVTSSGAKNTRGFAMRCSLNIFGGMGWEWEKTASAWLCQDFWEHYAFTQDKEYLRKEGYPIMKEMCEFWEDHLKTLPDGSLVAPNGWSPEHGPNQDGVSYDQEVVWDLFNNYVSAADALGVDKEYRDKVAGMRDKLLVPGIGSWGQLLEWMREMHDPQNPELDTPNDHHRHTSHLFAVYPGKQITMTGTPELAKAARVSLDARVGNGTVKGWSELGAHGDAGDVREWSFVWRTALYARLQDASDAHVQLQQLFSDRNTTPNLFGYHPPVQLDGNYGVVASIAEMLLQSQAGEIDLLPALPVEWPTGSVKGLRARGGYEVGIVWTDGKLTKASIHAINGGVCRIRYNGKLIEKKIKRGGTVTFTSADF
jgi:alpha-L-fucosidase 2